MTESVRKSNAAGEPAPRHPQAALRLPAGLLGMVALVAAGEWYVAQHEDHLTGMSTYAWRSSERAARGEARGHRILCLGTSLTKFGVLPRVLASRFNALLMVISRRSIQPSRRPDAS